MTGKAAFLVMMEPPAALEEEFNEWYDREHLPQRRGLPGFEQATRWRCMAGSPRWLAWYALASGDALHSDEYRAVSGDRSTPWSQRIFSRVRGLQRAVGETIEVVRHDGRRLSCLLVAAYPAADSALQCAQLRGQAAQRADLALLQTLRSGEGHDARLWVIAGFSSPASADSLLPVFGALRDEKATTFNLYTPYEPSPS